jgi:predicted PurR-regulated permease PerM
LNVPSKRQSEQQERQTDRQDERRRGWLGQNLALDLRDPTPFEHAHTFWRAASQAATIVMCVLMLGVLLYFARALVLPVLCAMTVALTIGPLIGALQRHGIAPWLTAMTFVLLLIALTYIAVVLLAAPASDLINRAPELGAAFADKMHFFDRPLAALSDLQGALGIDTGDKALSFNPAQLIGGLLTTVTPVALQFVLEVVLFFATLFFIILGRSGFRSYTVNWFASRESRLRALKILNDIEDNLGGYLIVVTAINLALGIVAAIMAMLLGLPSPILWGALAFVLNYVPYVGAAVMHVLLFIIGLVTYPTLLGALLPPAIYIAITTVEGQFITPAIVGRRVLSLHPLAVFLSIAFWAWLWGPLGAFLATPILIIARVALGHLYPAQKSELPG